MVAAFDRWRTRYTRCRCLDNSLKLRFSDKNDFLLTNLFFRLNVFLCTGFCNGNLPDLCASKVFSCLVVPSRGVMNGNRAASDPPCKVRYLFTGGKNAEYPVTFILTLTWHYNSIN